MTENRRSIWDFSSSEVDELYDSVQLNSYVYAAVKLVLDGSPPAGYRTELRNVDLPPGLRNAANHLTGLSTHLERDDTRNVRIHAVYRSFRLFSELQTVGLHETEEVMELLAASAYIPILSEKCDGFPLWYHPIPRKLNDLYLRVYALLRDNRDISTDESVRWKIRDDEKMNLWSDPLLLIFGVVPRAVQALIVCDENRMDPSGLEVAWRNLELQVREMERKLGMVQSLDDRIRLADPGMVRYRNTLYLYGGEFFRRHGDLRTAIDWYLKDIDYPELPDDFVFYLTDMKTTERLLTACLRNPDVAKRLRPVLKRCAWRILHNAADYARKVLTAVNRTPGADLGAPRVQNSDRTWLYAGEASREPFLFSLLYRWMGLGQDLAHPDYRRFFRYL